MGETPRFVGVADFTMGEEVGETAAEVPQATWSTPREMARIKPKRILPLDIFTPEAGRNAPIVMEIRPRRLNTASVLSPAGLIGYNYPPIVKNA